ncbi:MAG: hypothetical protein ACXQTH_01110 [Dehalococcoidia bacterium]
MSRHYSTSYIILSLQLLKNKVRCTAWGDVIARQLAAAVILSIAEWVYNLADLLASRPDHVFAKSISYRNEPRAQSICPDNLSEFLDMANELDKMRRSDVWQIEDAPCSQTLLGELSCERAATVGQ